MKPLTLHINQHIYETGSRTKTDGEHPLAHVEAARL